MVDLFHSNTTFWMPPAGRPCDYAETSSKTTGSTPMPVSGNYTMPTGHIRVCHALPGCAASPCRWIVVKRLVLKRSPIPSWPRSVLQVCAKMVPGRSAPIFRVQMPHCCCHWSVAPLLLTIHEQAPHYG